MIYEVKSNLLTQTHCNVIAHQVNACMFNTDKASGLAYEIAKTWPEAHPYRARAAPVSLGTISIVQTSGKTIVEMVGQFYPGGPREPSDSVAVREQAFVRCLQAILDANIRQIAFPANIGCGLAKGSWERYKSFICEKFSADGLHCWIVSQ